MPDQRFRAGWICQRIDDGASVFDIDSGDGMIPAYFQTKNAIVIPSDNSKACIEYLRKNGFDAVFLDLNEEEFAVKIPRVDHVVICEVLEHLANAETVLSAALHKAKYSVIFSVPKSGFYPYRLRLAMGEFPMQWRAHPGEHLRFWALRDMKWWLRALGLEDQAIIKSYEGTPILRNVWPSMFAAAMIVEVRTG